MPKKSALNLYLCLVFIIYATAIADTAVAATYNLTDSDVIQDTIDIASDTDEIILAPGTYKGIGNRDIDFKNKAITIKSTDPYDPAVVAATIIDCEDAGRGFYFHSGEGAGSVLRGVTIINGYAEDLNWPQDPAVDASGYGGAIYCTNSSPVIEYCQITDNTADAGGGAIFCESGSSASISKCDISYNYGGYGFYVYDVNLVNIGDVNQPGGGIFCKDASPTIADCNMYYNQAVGCGGAVGCVNSNAVIERCEISFNDCWVDDDNIIQYGGGIYCEGAAPDVNECLITYNKAKWCGGGIAGVDSDMQIQLCTITDNDCWASAGGIYSEGGFADPVIKNCVIANNWGYWSGGVSSSYNSDATIVNCTIADNVASYSHDPALVGGLECYYGDATVTNSILWGNTGQQIAGIVGGVTYSDVQMPASSSIWQGVGNINADPLFADPVRADYHLQTEYANGRYNPETGVFDADDPATSPCINAGDPASDYSLEPMENGGRINMGAYGGTGQASKSDITVYALADINLDSVVDSSDLGLLCDNWLLQGLAIIDPRADLNGDDIVDFYDFAIFAWYW